MDENGLPNNAANFVNNVNLVKFLKFRNLVKIQKCGGNSEIWKKF